LIVKILGAIDLVAALAFLTIIFGTPLPQLILFSAGLLLVKGLFAFTGDVLSFLDLFAALILFISLFFALPAFLISDGTINIIALLVALYFEKKPLAIIEEPERNIHPYLISRVVDMMKDAWSWQQNLPGTDIFE